MLLGLWSLDANSLYSVKHVSSELINTNALLETGADFQVLREPAG